MKKLLLGFYFILSQGAYAATSVNISVGGTILPPSCNLTLQGGSSATFAFGSIPQGNLNLNTSTTLSESPPQLLAIACAGPTVVAFNAFDNRSGSLVNNRFSLGQDGAGNLIGFYQIFLKTNQALADGATGKLKWSQTNGATWSAAPTTMVFYDAAQFNEIVGIDGNSTAGSPLQAITNASIPIAVTPTISARSTLDMSTQIVLDGSATIELIYL